MDTIVNKVAQSGIVSINFEDWIPNGTYQGIDMKQFLWQEMVLREKDFRAQVAEINWSQYRDCFVNVFCSVDAIIPTWAWMVIANAIEPFASKVMIGSEANLKGQLILQHIQQLDVETYRNARVVVKGCADIEIPNQAFVDLTMRLKPVVKSLFFGEPCSTVPILKNK